MRVESGHILTQVVVYLQIVGVPEPDATLP